MCGPSRGLWIVDGQTATAQGNRTLAAQLLGRAVDVHAGLAHRDREIAPRDRQRTARCVCETDRHRPRQQRTEQSARRSMDLLQFSGEQLGG